MVNAGHRHPPADGDPGRGLGTGGHHRLGHRAAGGDGGEVLVAGPGPAGQAAVGGAVDDVEPQGAGLLEGGDHPGQGPLGLQPEAGMEEVQQPELVHPPPGPRRPRPRPGAGARRRVTLEDDDLVAVVGQEHGRDEPGHAAAGDHDGRQPAPPSPWPRRVGPGRARTYQRPPGLAAPGRGLG